MQRKGGTARTVSNVQGNGALQAEAKAVAATSGTVTFPRAFKAAPVVTTTPLHATNKQFVVLTAVTVTGFSWSAYDDTGAASSVTTLHYTAMGVLA